VRAWLAIVFATHLSYVVSGCSSDDALEPEGKGVTPAQSYPTVLANLSGRTVVNAGISGELSMDGAARIPGVLARSAPELVILMHGGNDILQNRSQQDLKKNVKAMVSASQAAGAQVVLIGVPEKKLFSSTAPLYKELANEMGLVIEDGIVSSLLKKPAMKSDSVHFNAAGYGAIAERLHDLLKENGAL